VNDRYSRQELFAPIGKEGQRRLGERHVLIIGAGALGTGNAEILVRAGVGKVTIVDRDYVDWSNLQRQQLYTEEDAIQRMPKAAVAAERLKKINSSIEIEAKIMDVTPVEIESLTEGIDLMIDASDNFDIRMIMNDISQKKQIPWIYGAVLGSYGISYAIIPGKTPCLSCLLETIPIGGATCDTVGVIAPAVQMVVTLQTAEALKWLTGNEEAMSGRLTSFDLWKNEYASIRVDKLKKEDCPSCGVRAQYPFLSASNLSRTAVLCGRDTVQIRPPKPQSLDLDALGESLSSLGL
jgi:sulfur carrier protein ThiS adenylyltransferase